MPRLFATEAQRHRERDRDKLGFAAATTAGTAPNLRSLWSPLSRSSVVKTIPLCLCDSVGKRTVARRGAGGPQPCS